MSLSISVLGTFQLSIDGTPIDTFSTNKVRALFAFLAIEADQPHERSFLAGLLWPNQSSESARSNLRYALTNLRRTIGDAQANPPFLHITRRTLQFNVESEHTLDLTQLMRASQVSEQSHQQLEAALDVYQGSLLEGFALDDSPHFEEWLMLKREIVQSIIIELLERVSVHYAAEGQYRAASQMVARQLTLEPWREESHRARMRYLALDGQRSAALQQYENCRRLLNDELGVEPARETIVLFDQIRMGRLVQAERLFSSNSSATAIPVLPILSPDPIRLHNFPTYFTHFLGRESELEQICKPLVMPNCRLLTLVGPGGVGKTRLAIQAAKQLAETDRVFPDGLYFVPLETIALAAQFDSLLATTLGYTFQGQTETRQQLADYLQSRDLLLILDNFEHLVTQVDFVYEFLVAIPHVKMLITSREPLNIRAEWRVLIEGLTYPAAKADALEGVMNASPEADKSPIDRQIMESIDERELSTYSAVQLFMHTAHQIVPHFTPTLADQQAIIEICRTVDGTPLALEIAATWLRMVDCSQIAREIARNVDFLVTPLRDLPERHRSMRAVFEHSWQLLTPIEQQTLAQLSIFCSGFTLDAALAITDAPLPVLPALLDKALLAQAMSGRYTLHELARQFAAEKLSTGFKDVNLEGNASERHCHYYLKMVAEQAHHLKSPEPQVAVACLQQELGNIRQAWQWALHRVDLTALWSCMDGLAGFYEFTGLVKELYFLVKEKR